MPDGFSVDAHGLQDLALKLRHSAERARLEVDVTLAKVGEEHAMLAKEIAGQHSTSIPPTIRSTPLPGMVKLTAGGPNTPIAELYEIGNRGGKRASPTFRHPVFGRDVWVEQPRFRFFAAARSKLRLQTTEQLIRAWKGAMRSAGLQVEED